MKLRAGAIPVPNDWEDFELTLWSPSSIVDVDSTVASLMLASCSASVLGGITDGQLDRGSNKRPSSFETGITNVDPLTALGGSK